MLVCRFVLKLLVGIIFGGSQTVFVPLLRVFLFRYFFLYKKYISNKIDEFCNESGFWLKDYVCICLYLISVPLLPGSGAFPVLRSRWQVKMVFLWVSPILAPAWSTFFNELDFWIVQCPPTTSVLAAPWCLCSVADPEVVTVLPVFGRECPIFAVVGSTP